MINAHRYGSCLLALLALVFPASAQEKVKKKSPKEKLELTMRVVSADPFHESNEHGKPAPKVLTVAPGDVIEVEYTGKVKDGGYTYSINDTNTPPEFHYKAEKEPNPFVPLLPLVEVADVQKAPYENKVYLKIYGDFTWRQQVVVLPDTKPGAYSLISQVSLQVCDKDRCLPLTWPDMVAQLSVEGPARELTAELKNRINAAKAPTPGSQSNHSKSKSGDVDLLGFLGAAFFGAFLMLLTPCVFPMIPITVNFFLKQSEKEHHRPLPMAMVYSATIILVLSLSVLLFGKLIIDLANNAWFNLVLGLAMVYFALSLFGMYEIELPSFLSRFTSSREGKGGMEGTIFMALTFTITSFTCTGPFLGLMLGLVATAKVSYFQLILGALVYSATFAAPFFLLALFPSFLKKLPKSGGWLNTVKVTMGFLEIAFALKFLANTDIAWFPGNPILFNYDTVLVAWIVLSLACGLYLLGTFRLPHDDPTESTGVLRMLCGVLMFGLSVYMVPLFFGGKPKGVVANGIVAFLPPDLNHHGYLDYDEAYKEAVAQRKPIFIDFTGVNCTNCRDNEKNVFTRPDVGGLLKKYVVVQLYTDTVPKAGFSASEAKQQAKIHANWRTQLVKDESNPFYVIFQPDRAAAYDNGIPKGEIIDTRDGKIFDNQIGDFVSFLSRPLAN